MWCITKHGLTSNDSGTNYILYSSGLIIEEFIDDMSKASLVAITPASVNISSVGLVLPPLVSRNKQRRRKKARYNANQISKKSALKNLKLHTEYLRQMKMYDDDNLNEEMPPNPSYSLMHSLEEGFFILMYSSTHRTKLGLDMCMLKYNAVRIILPEWMAVIWLDSLFHAGAKFQDGLQDMRLCSYIWPHVAGN